MSKEERLTWKAEKRRRQEEKVETGHKKVKKFISSFGVATPKKDDSVINKSAKKADAWYENNFGNVMGIFSSRNYPYPDIPEERINNIIEHPDGTMEPIDVTPEIKKPWVCNYYYTPHYRARLAISIFVLMAMIFAVVMATTINYTWHTTAALVLLSLLLINVSFRYLGLAIYKFPMPKIPWVSDFRIYRQPEDELDDDETYEEVLEQNLDTTPVVTPVERYNGEYPSPATLLTRWMNGVARMSETDLIDQSGGALDSFRVRLLMKDDEDAWSDTEIVDVVSKITGSRPQQWYDAWSLWNN